MTETIAFEVGALTEFNVSISAKKRNKKKEKKAKFIILSDGILPRAFYLSHCSIYSGLISHLLIFYGRYDLHMNSFTKKKSKIR